MKKYYLKYYLQDDALVGYLRYTMVKTYQHMIERYNICAPEFFYGNTNLEKLRCKLNQSHSNPKIHERAKYRIRVCGIVGESWADYFSGMTIRVEDELEQKPETMLIGWLPDQTALLGMLNLLHDWGHSIISVNYLPSEGL
ncbi:hypothetical protein ACFLV7_11970 [Chloroflexota bacterium]